MTRDTKASIVVGLVFGGIIAYLLLTGGVVRTASSKWDQTRYHQLRALQDALEAYVAETGAWPPELQVLKERNPDLDLPPASGSKRVEYLGPPSPGGPLFRSFGHREPNPGPEGRFEPAYWEFFRDGTLRVHKRPEGEAPAGPGRASGTPEESGR